MPKSGALSQAIQFSQRRLSRTVDHVLKHWIPVNRSILGTIRKRLDRGSYDGDRDALITDLRSDVSLYTWCLQELCRIAEDNGDNEHFDPIRSLEDIDLAVLRDILDVDSGSISIHELESSDEHQIRVLQQVLLGATTANVLTEKLEGDSRAFGASLLRQLGLTLIAWNYPLIFKESLELARESGDLDVELSKKLGFSPGLLAMQIAKVWGVSEQKCHSLALVMPHLVQGESGPEILMEEAASDDGSFLREVCEFGQKLARLNDPHTYSAKNSEWEEVEAEVKNVLGEKGMAIIREEFEENCAHYAALVPSIADSDGPMFDRKRYPDTRAAADLIKRNKHLDKCSADVKVNLKKVYERMDGSRRVERETLMMIVHDTIPGCGFQGGCVYTFDPTLSKLIPQLKFGTLLAHSGKAVDYTLNLANADFIAEAFQKVDPLSNRVASLATGSVMQMATTLGRSRRLGVLYLEIPTAKLKKGERLAISHLEAIARALSDCLRV